MQRSSKEDYFKRVARSANAPSITVGKEAGQKAREGSEINSESIERESSILRNQVLEASYSFLARLILKTLHEPDHASVFDLLSPLDLTTEQLLPVIRRMEDEGLIKVNERDRTGNWKIEPTAKGQELLK